MEKTNRRSVRRALIRIGWGAVALGVGVYAAFALSAGIAELLHQLGVVTEVKFRATPIVFVVHAIAGTLALLIGPLQSIKRIRRRVNIRAALGRTYVVAVWVTSISGAVDALSFDVSPSAKLLFIAIAGVWFITTTIGMFRARDRRVVEQHEWMLRSYSLALFFVTFSLWYPALAATSLPASVTYPLSQILSALLNIGIAELYIRRKRRIRRMHRAGALAVVA